MKTAIIIGCAAIVLAGCQTTVSPDTRIKNLKQLCERNGFSEKNHPRANEVCVQMLVEDAGKNNQLSAKDYAAMRAVLGPAPVAQ